MPFMQEDQDLEHQDHIEWLASGVALALLLMHSLQDRPETLPLHYPAQLRQWIAQFVQRPVAVFKVEKSGLHRSLQKPHELQRMMPDRWIFRSAQMSAQTWHRDAAWGEALIMNRAAVWQRSAQLHFIVRKWGGATGGSAERGNESWRVGSSWVACQAMLDSGIVCGSHGSSSDFQADFLRVAAAL